MITPAAAPEEVNIELDDAPIIDDIPLESEEIEEPQLSGGECLPDPIADNTDARISLTYDAALVQHVLNHDRAEQRAKVSFNRRSANDYLSIYEEELASCEARDWWDNITYPTGDMYM
jgi:hypothetical protein